MKAKLRHNIKTAFLSIFLLAAMIAPQFIHSAWVLNVFADQLPVTVATEYFYSQLTHKNERTFYQAMRTMLELGYFKRGDVSVEVAGLESIDDKPALLKDMGAARDAFLLDYPELFYVDFDYLTLNVSTDASGNQRVSLGVGRGDSYLNKEFLNVEGEGENKHYVVNQEKLDRAISDVNGRIEEIVEKAKGKTPREQVELVHDEIIKAAAYKLEYQASNPYSVRTIYGVFGLGSGNNAGNAVCEGFARAMKTVLDRLGVPTVLVRGVYMREENKPEEHMWVYVMVDGGWYGVDATFDNDSEDKTGNISHEYLLAEGNVMPKHYPTGVISTSEKEFTYPPLENGDAGETQLGGAVQKGVVYDADGIKVEYLGETPINGTRSNKTFRISYNGGGYAAAQANGRHIIINSWQMRNNHETDRIDTLYSDWLYPIYVPELFELYEDTDEGILVAMDTSYAFQVGITKLAPKEQPDSSNDYTIFFNGEDRDILQKSEAIKTGNEASEYAQPFILRASPEITLKQRVGRTYHVTVEYDQDLIYKDENDQKIGYELLLYDRVYGYRQANEETMQYKIDNLQLVDKRTVTFDFTPSRLWSLDETIYEIHFTGVMGAISHKDPNPIGYALSNPVIGCIYQLRDLGIDMEAYGKPTLMDDFDLEDIVSASDLGLDDEKFAELMATYGELLKRRLALVTTETTEREDAKLQDALTDKLATDDRVLDEQQENATKTKVKTYNISLSLCTCQLERLKDGTRIRVKLGFPEGYGPDDAGVTFKAYHYTENADGTYTVEEIPCTITEYGLIIEVNAFSPFAIAALESDDTKDQEEKVIRLESSAGGKILDSDNKVAATVIHPKGDTEYTFTAKADPGYRIESLTIDGQEIKDAAGQTEYAFQIRGGSHAIATFGAVNPDPDPDPSQPGGSEKPGDTQPSKPEAPNTGVASEEFTNIVNDRLYSFVAVLTVVGIAIIIKRRMVA